MHSYLWVALGPLTRLACPLLENIEACMMLIGSGIGRHGRRLLNSTWTVRERGIYDWAHRDHQSRRPAPSKNDTCAVPLRASASPGRGPFKSITSGNQIVRHVPGNIPGLGGSLLFGKLDARGLRLASFTTGMIFLQFWNLSYTLGHLTQPPTTICSLPLGLSVAISDPVQADTK